MSNCWCFVDGAVQMFPMHSETATNLVSLLFFAKKLRIMHDFFQRCQEMAAELNGEMMILTHIVSIAVYMPVLHCNCITSGTNGLGMLLKYEYAVAVRL